MTLEDEDDDSESEEDEPEEEPEEVPANNKAERVLQICSKVAKLFPFDIFKEQYLNVLKNDSITYMVRVYLISA